MCGLVAVDASAWRMAKGRLRSFDDVSQVRGRTKFDVLGVKKNKTNHKKQKEEHKTRDKTLLVEYRRRNRNNRFVDRRFVQVGEDGNDGQDNAIDRFQKVRIQQIKKDPKYNAVRNTEDEVEHDTNVLTHGGKPLDELDDEEIEREAMLRAYAEEDEGSGMLSAKETALLNFGGGEENEDGDPKRKTKAEVMSEIIAKSKMYKALKAKQRENDLDLLKSLDNGFRELMKEGRPMGSKTAGNKTNKQADGATVLSMNAEEEEAYDRSAKELVFEMRAKAGERTKTEEEIQAEEEARKEKLERQKRKRMDKNESEESGESDIDEGEGNQGTLALDFNHEEDEELESGSTSTGGSTEGNDDDEAGDSDATEEEEDPKKENAAKTGDLAKGNGLPSVANSAGFTTPRVPEEYRTFAKIADGLDAVALTAWVQKLRKKNPQTQEERKNMQVLYGYLMQYFARLGGARPIESKKLDALVGPLFEMSAQLPMYAQMVAHSRIVKMQDVHNATLRDETLRGWPSPQVIVQIKLWCLLFPGSDFAHPILGPLSLLIGSYLTYCPVVDLQDALTGMLLCGCALQLVQPAKRYFPEAINFLTGILDGSKWQDADLVARLAAVRKAPPPEAQDMDSTPIVRPVYEFLSTKRGLASLGGRDAYLELLDNALDILQSFCTLLDDDWAAPELLEDIQASLSALGTVVVRPSLDTKRVALATRLSNWSRSIRAERVRLPVASGGSVTVKKTYNPRFEEDYVRGRDYDVDRERSAMRRLRREFASEAKGAARELKKDNYYLAEQRRREAQEASASLRAEQQRNFGMLEQLEADMRSGGQSGGFSRKKGKQPRKHG